MRNIEIGIFILFAMFMILQLADAFTTTVIIDRGGRELNRFLAWVMDRIGVVPALLAVKSLTMVIMAWLVFIKLIGFPQHTLIVLALIDAFYVYIVCSNIAVIKGR